ncbi:hypothetical protein J6590_064954 [Homalodisca vitripennis]|nr:hypothetical protein J6590_064954 [Homalodisca vitripennis]
MVSEASECEEIGRENTVLCSELGGDHAGSDGRGPRSKTSSTSGRSYNASRGLIANFADFLEESGKTRVRRSVRQWLSVRGQRTEVNLDSNLPLADVDSAKK